MKREEQCSKVKEKSERFLRKIAKITALTGLRELDALLQEGGDILQMLKKHKRIKKKQIKRLC